MAALRHDALRGHLEQAQRKGRLAALYIVASDEGLLQIEACDAIRACARKLGYTEREVVHVGARFDWSLQVGASQSMSLFAEKKIVELRLPTGKPGKEGGQALIALAEVARTAQEAGDDSTLTIIALPRVDRDMKASKWFAALSGIGMLLDIPGIERSALPGWIEQRLGLQGQAASRDALNFIADLVEGNLLAAHQEISKLGLLYPQRTLTLDEVHDAVLNVARYDVFKLGEALLAGDAARFVRMLQGLKAEGEPMPLVLWTVAEELRTLARLKQAEDAGRPVAALMQELRIWGPRERLLPLATARLSGVQIEQAIRTCSALDKMSKGLGFAAREAGLTGEVWGDLLALGMRLMPKAAWPA
jgi:DNA polymerase-3 subunit delta